MPGVAGLVFLQRVLRSPAPAKLMSCIISGPVEVSRSRERMSEGSRQWNDDEPVFHQVRTFIPYLLAEIYRGNITKTVTEGTRLYLCLAKV